MTVKVVTKQSGGLRRRVLSKAYTEAKNLQTRPTEWAEGRPIYDRLPSASESYKQWFFEDGEQGYVYIAPNTGSNGPGSLEVVVSDDRESILVFGGKALWKYGESVHNPVVINLKEVGLQNTKYLIAYQMSYDDQPKEVYEEVEEFPITGLDLTTGSSADSVIGWRFPSTNAFSSNSDLVWKNSDVTFPIGKQPNSCSLSCENIRPFFATIVRAICPSGFIPGAEITCELFGDSEFLSRSEPVKRSDGRYEFSFYLDNKVQIGEIEFVWDNLAMEVQEVLVSGSFPTLYRPKTTTMSVNLVAYPFYEYPEEFTYCRLAEVDVDSDYRVIGEAKDVRTPVFRTYEPVAEWLTRPWDSQLANYYEEHKNFVERRMAPKSVLSHAYLGLEEYGISVS